MARMSLRLNKKFVPRLARVPVLLRREGWTAMCRKGLVAIAALVVSLSSLTAFAVTKTVDLDAQTANGAESKCDLNVLSSFPVQIENVVTNKAVGDSFIFNWLSAGPGGFNSSVTPGTT